MIEPQSEVRPRLSARLRYQRTSAGLLLYEPSGDAVYEANLTARGIIELLDGMRTCDAISRTIAQRWRAEQKQVLADVLGLVQRLQELELLE